MEEELIKKINSKTQNSPEIKKMMGVILQDIQKKQQEGIVATWKVLDDTYGSKYFKPALDILVILEIIQDVVGQGVFKISDKIDKKCINDIIIATQPKDNTTS